MQFYSWGHPEKSGFRLIGASFVADSFISFGVELVFHILVEIIRYLMTLLCESSGSKLQFVQLKFVLTTQGQDYCTQSHMFFYS